MKRTITLSLLILGLALSAAGQVVEKPTLTPKPASVEQTDAMNEGIRLYGAGNFDGAIAKFDGVLKDNPDCVEAKYQLALTLYAKSDRVRAEAVARDGAKYKSDQLPLFYTIIGNTLDDAGKSVEAVEMYHRSIELLKKDPARRGQLAETQYNLAYSHVRQNQLPEARTALKESVASDFSHANANLLLTLIYKNMGYKMPALMAATRYLGLVKEGQTAKQAAAIFLEIVKPASKDPQTGNINIMVNTNAPKDEGDFGMFELVVGTATTLRGDDDKGKSDDQIFAEGVSTIFAIAVENKELKNFFVGKYYVPYLDAMKKAGHQEAFAYVVLQLGGNAAAATWVTANQAKVAAYYHWAASYRAVP